MSSFDVKTGSAEETVRFGIEISNQLKAGDVIALEGELGSGKTTLMKGIAKGLGLEDESSVTSPTFVLMHIYETNPMLYHFDLYRLENNTDFESVGLEEHLRDPQAIKCIEWAGKARALLPKGTHWIGLEAVSENERKIKIVSERLSR